MQVGRRSLAKTRRGPMPGPAAMSLPSSSRALRCDAAVPSCGLVWRGGRCLRLMIESAIGVRRALLSPPEAADPDHASPANGVRDDGEPRSASKAPPSSRIHRSLAVICLVVWSLTLSVTSIVYCYHLDTAAFTQATQPLPYGSASQASIDTTISTASSAAPAAPPPLPPAPPAVPSDAALLLPVTPSRSRSGQGGSVCLYVFNGQFGNQVFQTMMAVTVAFSHRLLLYLPWTKYGDVLYLARPHELPCPASNSSLALGDSQWAGGERWWEEDPRRRVSDPNSFSLTISGLFQYPSAVFAPYSRQIRAMLSPQPAVLETLQALKASILSSACNESVLVGMHIREGIAASRVNYSFPSPVAIPLSWYVRWLQAFGSDRTLMQQAKDWQDRDCPLSAVSPFPYRLTVFLATNIQSMPDRLRAAGFRVITLADVLSNRTDLQQRLTGHAGELYADWWMLGQFRVVVAGHSSFSVTAAMYSPHSDRRPGPVLLARCLLAADCCL